MLPDFSGLSAVRQGYLKLRIRDAIRSAVYSNDTKYRSKAYRAYLCRLLRQAYIQFNVAFVDNGVPVPNRLQQLGMELADCMFVHANRPGFARMMLDDDYRAQVTQERQENDQIVAAYTEAFKAILLPYSRHIDYTNKAIHAIPVPAN